MPPIAQIKTIKLYAPSLDTSIFNFILKPSQSHATILKSISKALDNPAQAWPYNFKREPIDDFKTVEAGQTLLIATCYFERPLAEEVRDVLIVQPGAAERAWMELGVEKKREYIGSLEGDGVYLTLLFVEVKGRFARTSVPSIEACLATTEANWGLPIDAILGFQGMIMPHGEMETWEEKLVAALAVLSEATVGQGMVVSGLLMDEVKRQRGRVVDTRDVLEVGKELYRRAMGEAAVFNGQGW
jgi:hypothetical protein